MTDDRERKAAAAKFKKSERATEGAKAMADYKAEGEAERAKTVRNRNGWRMMPPLGVVSDPPADGGNLGKPYALSSVHSLRKTTIKKRRDSKPISG